MRRLTRERSEHVLRRFLMIIRWAFVGKHEQASWRQAYKAFNVDSKSNFTVVKEHNKRLKVQGKHQLSHDTSRTAYEMSFIFNLFVLGKHYVFDVLVLWSGERERNILAKRKHPDGRINVMEICVEKWSKRKDGFRYHACASFRDWEWIVPIEVPSNLSYTSPSYNCVKMIGYPSGYHQLEKEPRAYSRNSKNELVNGNALYESWRSVTPILIMLFLCVSVGFCVLLLGKIRHEKYEIDF